MSASKNKVVVCLTFLFLLAGCSVRYTERVPGFQPGYEEQRLGEDTWQVRIGEAWPKDWPDLEKFGVYRAAEITTRQGRRYFEVIDASTNITSYSIPVPTQTVTNGL